MSLRAASQSARAGRFAQSMTDLLRRAMWCLPFSDPDARSKVQRAASGICLSFLRPACLSQSGAFADRNVQILLLIGDHDRLRRIGHSLCRAQGWMVLGVEVLPAKEHSAGCVADDGVPGAQLLPGSA